MRSTKHIFTLLKKDHDTPLHKLSRECRSSEDFHDFIKKHPINDVVKMALTTNNQGKVSLDLIFENDKLDVKNKNSICKTLVSAIKQHQMIKPFAEPISIDAVLKEHEAHASPELNENLHLACEVINDIRKVIKYSPSHPDYNHFNIQMQAEIRIRTEQFRLLTESFKTYDQAYSAMQKLETANCGELGFAAINLLETKTTKKMEAMKLGLTHGDHGFVIFASSLFPDPRQYPFIDSDAVFCDPWLGHAGKFNLENMMRYLGTRKYVMHGPAVVNYIASFNPHYHNLAVKNTYLINAHSPNQKFFGGVQKKVEMEEKSMMRRLGKE